MSTLFVDYIRSKECKNKDAWYICLKCGECGRKFDEDGIMIDAGGTRPDMKGEQAMQVVRRDKRD